MLTKGFGPPSPGNPAAASLRRSVPRHSAVQLSSPRKALYGMAIISMVGLAMACNNQSRSPRNIEPAFYYWKSVYDPSALEKKYMDSLRVNTLYVRFFDVDWDEVNRQPAPKALVRFVQKPTAAVIPTLFITNETLLAIDSAQAQALGGNLVRLLKGLLEKYDLPMPGELQIDCDWSASTKAQYFALLRAVKKTMPGPTLSATIRLYQTKYYDRAGVPPVDKGLLMCYNMGNLKYAATGNSIIETNELQKYTGNLASYPLPLDVGLPLFDWKVWFRQGKYHGITQALPDSLLKRPVFAADPPALGSQRFTVLQDTVLAGYPLQKGDLLRLETSDYPVVLAAAQHLAQRLKNTQCRVSLYHLDSVLLAKYSRHELESLFNGLR